MGRWEVLVSQMERKTWGEFSRAGMLWWLNTILHGLGWSIVMETDEETGEVLDVFPARTSWYGFPDEVNDEELAKFRAHVREGL